jgi:hypothetical protein
MVYTRQQVLDHYNQQRGTNFNMVQLATQLLTEKIQSELSAMLRTDAKAVEDAQIASI